MQQAAGPYTTSCGKPDAIVDDSFLPFGKVEFTGSCREQTGVSALADARDRIAQTVVVRRVSLGPGISARAVLRRKMAGQGTAGRILPEVIRVDRLHPHGFGRCRRQAHRARNVQRQIKIEIRRQRGGRCRAAGDGHLAPAHPPITPMKHRRDIGGERDVGRHLDAGLGHRAGVVLDYACSRLPLIMLPLKMLVASVTPARNRAAPGHRAGRDKARRCLGDRCNAGGVRPRPAALPCIRVARRVVDRATDRRYQRHAGHREDHRDIAALVACGNGQSNEA